MPNRLAGESSPYLLQHKDNPVDWYPWGEEAFERARSENKPVFLSVGYSSCHWCHVMEHESFENDAVAAILNESYISVKVDREERPDVDEAYMTAVQLSSGRGGWPMSVFLTPDKKPFFAGTYFPREDRGQHAGFLTLCRQISLLWKTKRAEVESNADEFALGLSEALGRRAPSTFAKFDEAFLADAVKALAADFDNDHGGFGKAPKFPPHTSIDLLIRYAVRPTAPEDLRELAIGMAFGTLHQMAVGGIHDHVGGGFHRYSTDEFWLLPHFEKMLYDNALMIGNYALAAAMLHGVDENLSSFFGVTAAETSEWVHRELTSSDGSFFSALDADSEGEEGKFYVWKLGEIREVLSQSTSPEQIERFVKAFGLREEGNFEDESTGQLTGENILQRLESDDDADFGEELDLLMAARELRPHPGLDDKILVSWNGLMIRGLADAGLVDMAADAADAILEAEAKHGYLPHQIVKGLPSGRGFLDDYAAFADGLFSLAARLSLPDQGAVPGGKQLAQAYIEHAKRLTKEMLDQFWDEEDGGFFGTSEKHEQLFGRTKPAFDSPTPSANALALRCLIATGDLDRANRLISAFLGWMEQAPQATEALFAAALSLAAEGEPVKATEKVDTPSAPAEVVVRLEPKEIRAEANGTGRGELVFSVPDGLHLNSNNPPARWLIATAASFQPVKAVVTYPNGDTYEGDFRIPFTLELPSGSSGEEFEVRVTYQACTDSECLLPAEKVLSGVLIRS